MNINNNIEIDTVLMLYLFCGYKIKVNNWKHKIFFINLELFNELKKFQSIIRDCIQRRNMVEHSRHINIKNEQVELNV